MSFSDRHIGLATVDVPPAVLNGTRAVFYAFADAACDITNATMSFSAISPSGKIKIDVPLATSVPCVGRIHSLAALARLRELENIRSTS